MLLPGCDRLSDLPQLTDEPGGGSTVRYGGYGMILATRRFYRSYQPYDCYIEIDLLHRQPRFQMNSITGLGSYPQPRVSMAFLFWIAADPVEYPPALCRSLVASRPKNQAMPLTALGGWATRPRSRVQERLMYLLDGCPRRWISGPAGLHHPPYRIR